GVALEFGRRRRLMHAQTKRVAAAAAQRARSGCVVRLRSQVEPCGTPENKGIGNPESDADVLCAVHPRAEVHAQQKRSIRATTPQTRAPRDAAALPRRTLQIAARPRAIRNDA